VGARANRLTLAGGEDGQRTDTSGDRDLHKQKIEQNDRAWPLPKWNLGGGGWRGACLEGTLGSLAVLDVARESPHNGVGNTSLRLDHEVV
jgi:hypothetical protein